MTKKQDETMNEADEDLADDTHDEEKEDEMDVEKDEEETGAEDDDEDEDEDEDNKTSTTNTTDGKKKIKKKSVNTHLPVARIRRIIKSDKDVKLIANDATLLITKSTELFLDFIVRESYKKTTGKRKILQYKDIASTVKEIESLEFLSDIIPPKVLT
ncbi:putative histone-like transcription factor [Heterostelium album PN500]|uniref:Chromatin accessibility complex protein 1 n=1 Tax=Heterostelium pallidum (strain ATCC 26659 / Pp 5 / PN500) TaxID=670386 RepID=D3B2U2_HETP5|nr:putative histone-like transcription factor [Heterostelium album PN500]EFA83640.1 putative histone-like transcription factor [Heterostelium album PN500]|eukprot:XP_020435757.1 putative histone-like transcription factor [Heterostelium album PN500]